MGAIRVACLPLKASMCAQRVAASCRLRFENRGRPLKIEAGCHGLAAQRSGHAIPQALRLEPQAFRTTPITPLRFVLGRATRVYFHRRHGNTEVQEASPERELRGTYASAAG